MISFLSFLFVYQLWVINPTGKKKKDFKEKQVVGWRCPLIQQFLKWNRFE